MTAKEWLQRGWKIDREIAALERLKTELWTRATSTTASASPVVVQSSGDPHKFDAIVAVAEKIDARIQSLAAVRGEIIETVGAVPEPALRALLLSRYVEFRPWEQIAVDMGYSWRQIHRLHARALAAVDDVLQKMA